MTLSCSCDWGGPEPGEWYWDGCSKQQPMPERKRRARCCSCKGFINTGDIAGSGLLRLFGQSHARSDR